MSRIWACDRCGITAPESQLLPSGWERVMVRALPKVDRDVCPPCLHDLDQALQDWFVGQIPTSTKPDARPPESVPCADYGSERRRGQWRQLAAS